MDGCQVPIKRPSTPDAEECRIQENWFSINFQGGCISNLKLSNTVVCCKGPIHTQFKEFSLIIVSFIEGHIMDNCWGTVVMLSRWVHPVHSTTPESRLLNSLVLFCVLFFTLFLQRDVNRFLPMSAFSRIFRVQFKVLSHGSIQFRQNRRDMIY